MSQHPLYAYPDIPKSPAQPVIQFDQELHNAVEVLKAAVSDYQLNCVAASHLNLAPAIFVIQSEVDENQFNIYINPKIISQSQFENCVSDCLFFPYSETVIKRPLELELTYQDLDGVSHNQHFKDQDAVLISYLTDCLNGKTILDYMSAFKKQRFLKLYKKNMQRQHACDSSCDHEH